MIPRATLLRVCACAEEGNRGRAPSRLLFFDELPLDAFARGAATHPPAVGTPWDRVARQELGQPLAQSRRSGRTPPREANRGSAIVPSRPVAQSRRCPGLRRVWRLAAAPPRQRVPSNVLAPPSLID